MADQWFTLDEVREKQKACPLSMGQAEAGRYTFCVGDQCMAWKWLTDGLQEKTIDLKKAKIPEGYEAAGEPVQIDKKSLVKIMQKPTHGRCGMVPRNG